MAELRQAARGPVPEHLVLASKRRFERFDHLRMGHVELAEQPQAVSVEQRLGGPGYCDRLAELGEDRLRLLMPGLAVGKLPEPVPQT